MHKQSAKVTHCHATQDSTASGSAHLTGKPWMAASVQLGGVSLVGIV
jgi:hypothetical protein